MRPAFATRAKAGILVHVQVSLELRMHISFRPLSICHALEANSESGIPRMEEWLTLVRSLAKRSGIAWRAKLTSNCCLISEKPCNHKQ